MTINFIFWELILFLLLCVASTKIYRMQKEECESKERLCVISGVYKPLLGKLLQGIPQHFGGCKCFLTFYFNVFKILSQHSLSFETKENKNRLSVSTLTLLLPS